MRSCCYCWHSWRPLCSARARVRGGAAAAAAVFFGPFGLQLASLPRTPGLRADARARARAGPGRGRRLNWCELQFELQLNFKLAPFPVSQILPAPTRPVSLLYRCPSTLDYQHWRDHFCCVYYRHNGSRVT
ncbi:hypothetical protein GALMADRAFT_918265 [Galerina marginata CBS 339.88]|uniref:Uncharacterized protein n=1 Tax=Galerina marginata (strain CBS 339.88) TaxID=685588 RepID=A0A067SFI4_GALM3|nr:hypothetical protein GALMADRAFT_918265 [Galerina marginata CBS 339.88]